MKKMTMRSVVGRRIRERREEVGLTQEGLRELLADVGLSWSRSTVAQLELGNRPIDVQELLLIGLQLGISPHLLMYPPQSADIDAAGRDVSGETLADWLYAPDTHPFTTAKRSERAIWFESARLAERLTPEAIEAFLLQTQAAEATAKWPRMAVQLGGVFHKPGVLPGKELDARERGEEQR